MYPSSNECVCDNVEKYSLNRNLPEQLGYEPFAKSILLYVRKYKSFGNYKGICMSYEFKISHFSTLKVRV
jgi:hypothetical protein